MKRRGNVISPIDSLTTVVEMLQQSDYTVEDGEIVWVRSEQTLFVYRVNAGLVPDGINVVASLYGNGVWQRLSVSAGTGELFFNTIATGAAGSGRLIDADPNGLKAGSQAWTESVGAVWNWEPASVLTADNITVVNPSLNGANPGRFIRGTESSRRSWLQVIWHIDAVNGNDENTGLTQGTSLASEIELYRRWGTEAVIDRRIDIFVHSALTDWQMDVQGNQNTLIYVHGDRLVQYTNNTTGISAKTDINPATNTRPTITDAVAPWAANVGGFVRSLVLNKTAVIAADQGAGVGRISNPIIEPANLATGAINPTVTTFAVNDTFQIESYYQILRANINLMISPPTPNNTVPSLIFENFKLGGLALTDLSQTFLVWCNERAISVVLAECQLSSITLSRAKSRINDCAMVGDQISFQEGTPLFSAGLGVSTAAGVPSAGLSHTMFQLNTIMEQNLTLTVGSAINVGNVPGSMGVNGLGIFTTSVDGLKVSYNGRLFIGAVAQPLWGTCGGATFGIRVDSGGYAQYAVKPTLTGGTSDTVIGGTTKAYAAVPYIEATNQAALVLAA